MRHLAISALLLAACGPTPYQHMGRRGGYSDEDLGAGRHIITVKVNGHTSRSTAFKYLHRRAGELCPGGYDVEDEDASTSTTYTKVGYGYAKSDKHEITAVVRCE